MNLRSMLMVFMLVVGLAYASTALASGQMDPATPVTQGTETGWHCFDWPAKNASAIAKVKVVLKSGGNEDVDKKLRIKITRIKYKRNKTPGPGTEEVIDDVAGTGSPKGTDSKDVPSSALRGSEYKFCVEITTYTPLYNPVTGVTTWDAATPVDKITMNFEWANDSGDKIAFTAAQGGPGSKLFEDGDTLVSFDTAAAGAGLSASDYSDADLIFTTPTIKVGTVRFVPTDGVRFDSQPQAVCVFDKSSTDLLAGGAIELGDATVNADGSLSIPVTSVDVDILGSLDSRIAFVVRGVERTLPTLDDDVVAGYVATGNALPATNTNVVPLQVGSVVLANWEVRTIVRNFEREGHDFVFTDGEPELFRVNYGGAPRVFIGESGYGYDRGIGISEVSAGSFADGDIYIQGVDSTTFLSSDDTKVFVFDADSHDNVSAHFDGGVSIIEGGILKVSLSGFTDSELASKRLKVFVVSPKLAFNAPLALGRTERVMVYGTGTKVPLTDTLILLEGGNEDWVTSTHSWTLGSGPYSIGSGWVE